jgi:hypothetical protein
MRTKDIKILWGRSGNRCAICKIELTPDGEIETIGEIAHIISQSSDGPRGKESLPVNNRNDYSNLILLCPNHHSEIDKTPESWPTTRLQKIKGEHEKWVSAQLEQGLFSYTPIDNTAFLKRIREGWNKFAGSRVWIIAALTPLSVDDESIDPLDDNVVNTLNEIKLPDDRFWDPHVNAYDTRPDENGVSNIRLDKLNKGDGHKLSVFRNGHCEFLFCLESSVKSITQYASEVDSETLGSSRIIRYTHLAEVITRQIVALKAMWINCLQFKNMTLTVEVLNTRETLLYSREKEWGGALYGYLVQSDKLPYSFVVDRNFESKELIETCLKRLVNYFGLVLDEILNNNGKLIRPRRI